MSSALALLGEASPPAWIAGRGAAAMATLGTQGLPHRRMEEWKYSDLREALSAVAPAGAAPADHPFAAVPGTRISFHDGRLATSLAALPPGLEACNLALHEPAPDWVAAHVGAAANDGLAGASLALMAGGLALRVMAGVTVEEPLELAFAATAPHHARLLIVVEEGASLTLLESHAQAAALANLGVEIVLQPGAMLRHVRLAESAAGAVLVETLALRQEAGSVYRAHYADFGARLSRLELHLTLAGAATQTALSGIQLLSEGRHSDVTVRLTHAVGGNASAQLFKQVAAEKARAAYQGRITVAKGADGTDARQVTKALLLHGSAEADLKPELIIFADDVKCAHGAAVGDLDGDALFYLRARGIPEGEARGMLLRAFVEDAVSEIEGETIRAAVWARVEAALAEVAQ